MDYLNQSGLSQQVIRENIDQNIIEELLTTLVSTKLLDLEINDLNLKVSEIYLLKKFKRIKTFKMKLVNFKEHSMKSFY